MNWEELLKSGRPPKKDEITDEDLARLFMKYRGLLKQWERDKAFSAATHENIRIASAKLDELVEVRTAELSKTNEKLRQAEARLQHLNLVLHAIRNVNQLIVKEKDRGRLLKGASRPAATMTPGWLYGTSRGDWWRPPKPVWAGTSCPWLSR